MDKLSSDYVPTSGSLAYSYIVGYVFGNYCFIRFSVHYAFAAANTNYTISSMYLNLSNYFSACHSAWVLGFPVILNAQSTATLSNVSVSPSLSVTDLSKIMLVVSCSGTGTYVSIGCIGFYGTRK